MWLSEGKRRCECWVIPSWSLLPMAVLEAERERKRLWGGLSGERQSRWGEWLLMQRRCCREDANCPRTAAKQPKEGTQPTPAHQQVEAFNTMSHHSNSPSAGSPLVSSPHHTTNMHINTTTSHASPRNHHHHDTNTTSMATYDTTDTPSTTTATDILKSLLEGSSSSSYNYQQQQHEYPDSPEPQLYRHAPSLVTQDEAPPLRPKNLTTANAATPHAPSTITTATDSSSLPQPPPSLDNIQKLQHDLSHQKSNLMSRMQQSLKHLHQVRSNFEQLLEEENIAQLHHISSQLQKMTKSLFHQLNEVIDERDTLAERASYWKSALKEKDSHLIRVMKREEIQVRKLRDSMYSQKRLKEKREEMIRLVFQKADEQALSAAEVRQLYEQTVALYDADSLHPVELHGKFGLKTQMSHDMDSPRSDALSSPVSPRKKRRTVVFNFSSLKDPRTIDYVRNQIKKDREWVIRVLETKDDHINNIVKQADSYYQRDQMPDEPDLRSMLHVKKQDLENKELHHLMNYKIEQNPNLSYQKICYNVDRIINGVYAADSSDSQEDQKQKEIHLSHLKGIHDMITPVLSQFDPKFRAAQRKMTDDLNVLREKCAQIKEILKAFVQDYQQFRKAAWADFERIRNMLQGTINRLEARIAQLEEENARLHQENASLKESRALPAARDHFERQSPPRKKEHQGPVLSPILAPVKRRKSMSPVKKHVCRHHHAPEKPPQTAPIQRPCYNRMNRNYFRDYRGGGLGGDGLRGYNGAPREVDVSLWFSEPEEESPRIRRFDRILHPFLNRSLNR